jgi:mannose/fructose/N-acetylgalactosamine-specific phosphotransferase system component IIB
MTLAGFRIDDRLLHGQVVENWLEVLRPKRVLVVSDRAFGDPLLLELYRAALPPGIGVEVLPVAGAAARIAATAREPVLVITASPEDALAILEEGAAVERVVVGGLHHAPGRLRVLDFIYLGAADRAALAALRARGVRLVAQDVPRRAEVDLGPLLDSGPLLDRDPGA